MGLYPHGYFSYDVHGRVLWAVQEMTINGQTKRVTADYVYSKLTSRVEAIIYQKNVAGETFAHRYLYDADNCLKQVLVSRTFDNAKTFWPTHGRPDYCFYVAYI
jgi:hypothetical protein